MLILVVGGDGVYDILALAVFFGDVRADQSVRALNFVVHGLADVVQQTGPLGAFDVHPQFGGHHAAQSRYFQ